MTLSQLLSSVRGLPVPACSMRRQLHHPPVHVGRFLPRRWKSFSRVAMVTTATGNNGENNDDVVSTVGAHTREKGSVGDNGELIDPRHLGPIPRPASLSPSAILEFKKCPQSYLFQYLYKFRQPTSLATAKGTMCHEALEHIFDLDPPSRTLEALQNLLRAAWGKQRHSDKYRFLFEEEDDDDDDDDDDDGTTKVTKEWNWELEKEWGASALQLLQNYYQVEDPKMVTRPNPLRREIWLHAHLTVDPSLGSTSTTKKSDDTSHVSSSSSSKPETFYMRGIVDRLDMVKVEGTADNAKGGVALKIVDYKTGKAPTLKYSKPMNDRIVEEAFYQLKVYALLLREKGASYNNNEGDASLNSLDLRYLELLYLNSDAGVAKPWRCDLGKTREERERVLQGIHQDLSQVWQDISDLVALQDPKAFVGCDRSFCHCHKCRERFVPGTVWEPEP